MKFRHQAQLCRFVPAVVLVCGLLPPTAHAQFFQQAPKLVGTGVIGPYEGALGPEQGSSVALSGDGSTAIVGGPFDNDADGAAWVFTRSGGVWSQQAKLPGVHSEQGKSVALSDDGNTAIVGGVGSISNLFVADGASVYTRVGGVWSQQARLVGTGQLQGFQGASVALSADGNTAIVGGPADGNGVGGAWVFNRSVGVWSQQAKLVGTGVIGPYAAQGGSVSLSSDGNTAIVGGALDNYNDSDLGIGSTGAAWVFTRSGGVWSQQAKLVGTDAIGYAEQGSGVSLSGDGTTAILGGPGDNGGIGAAWVFTQAGGLWSQQAKLVGIDVSAGSLSSDGNTAIFVGDGAALVYMRSDGVWTQQEQLVGTAAVETFEGGPVSLSSDGKTALVGGPRDNVGIGAAWVFAPLAGTPGMATCIGQSITTLIREFGGLNSAAASTDFPSVMALQNAIMAYCAGSDQVASTLP
jgi:hypothetical protein